MSHIHDGRQAPLISETAHLPVAAMPCAQNKDGAVAQYMFEKRFIVIQIIFQIGILTQDYISHGMLESQSDGISFAPRTLLRHMSDVGIILVHLGEFPGPVGRIALDKDDLPVHSINL